MKMHLTQALLDEIRKHGEAAYPDEAAGFLLGRSGDDGRFAELVLPAKNAREDGARQRRYEISPQEMMDAEKLAREKGMDVIAVFHSHPDHPERPSEFDRQWALPWFLYLITSVNKKKAGQTRAWQLSEDRKNFNEATLHIEEESSP